MNNFFANMTTEAIDLKVVNAAGCFFFAKSLSGAAWASLAAMVTELDRRTGDEMPGRFIARDSLGRASALLALKPADFGA